MMARRGMIGLLVGGVAALLGGCGLLGGNNYRFRMTVEVDTPLGVKSGFSVYEVTAGNTVKLLPEERSRDWSVKGEAVAVDLPGGKTLFALLKTTNPLRADLALMSMATLDPAFENDIVESAERIADGEGIRSPAEVSPSDYPLLVTFGDLDEPKSVERVEPAAVGVKRIVVEVTGDAVTTGIEKRLKWLARRFEFFEPDPVHGRFISPEKLTIAHNLRRDSFSTEIEG